MTVSRLFSKQFLLFLVFGGFAAVVNLTVGKILYDYVLFDFPYVLSVLIAAFSGLLVNFICNYTWNFTRHMRTASQHFQTFFVIATIGSFLTALLSRVILALLEYFAFPAFSMYGFAITDRFVAHFLSVGLVVFYSYFAHKYISFSDGFKGLWKRFA